VNNAGMRNELKIFMVEGFLLWEIPSSFPAGPTSAREKKEYSGPTLLITLMSGEPHLGKTQ
jgi:hypothetical protein